MSSCVLITSRCHTYKEVITTLARSPFQYESHIFFPFTFILRLYFFWMLGEKIEYLYIESIPKDAPGDRGKYVCLEY